MVVHSYYHKHNVMQHNAYLATDFLLSLFSWSSAVQSIPAMTPLLIMVYACIKFVVRDSKTALTQRLTHSFHFHHHPEHEQQRRWLCELIHTLDQGWYLHVDNAKFNTTLNQP